MEKITTKICTAAIVKKLHDEMDKYLLDYLHEYYMWNDERKRDGSEDWWWKRTSKYKVGEFTVRELDGMRAPSATIISVETDDVQEIIDVVIDRVPFIYRIFDKTKLQYVKWDNWTNGYYPCEDDPTYDRRQKDWHHWMDVTMNFTPTFLDHFQKGIPFNTKGRYWDISKVDKDELRKFLAKYEIEEIK